MRDHLPALLTMEEAAALLRVGRTKAYAMTREWRDSGGRSGLPVVDLGSVLRAPLDELERVLGVRFADSQAAPPSRPRRRAPAALSASPADPAPTAPVVSPSPTEAASVAARPSSADRRTYGPTATQSSDQLDLFHPTAS